MERLLESIAEDIAQLIEEMTVEELEEMIAYANGVLKRKKEAVEPAKKKYRFKFKATLDPRKGFPYVARLFWGDGKIERDFYSLKKQYGKKFVTVWGTFEAQEGDVVEMRIDASWKNDYRAWYLVHSGNLYLLTWISDSSGKAVVIDYLSGEITMEGLMKKLKVNVNNPDYKGEVID
jgi:hypothetical protein